jgi:hypothetical protein
MAHDEEEKQSLIGELEKVALDLRIDTPLMDILHAGSQ